MMKPESIKEVYKLITDLHTPEPLKKTYLVELGTIDRPQNFTVMRMSPSEYPNLAVYCSLDLNAPYYLACYNLTALLWWCT
jgi:hypothetical protein